MSTTRMHQTTTVAPGADGPTDDHHDLGDGRYRLGTAVSRRRSGGLWHGYDSRLGRAVFVQCHERTTSSTAAARRLAAAPRPGLAPVLDAGDAIDPAGRVLTWTVFPASGWASLAGPADSWPAVGSRDVAAVAAWIVATSAHVATLAGETVALRSSDVLVDTGCLAAGLTPSDRPVQWMPALGATDGDQLPEVVAWLGEHVDRRWRRRWAAATAPLADPHGRRRAARALAGVAGLDPAVLGLPPVAPHHAGHERRSSDRRRTVGVIPTTKRREIACESVEAFS